jgi:hypothetical protein
MLLRLAFLEGTGRSHLFDGGKLARVHVFANRIPMMHRASWQQDSRFEADAWEQAIVEYVTGKTRITVLEVAKHGLLIDTPKLGTADQRQITGILERLDWQHGPRGSAGERWWVPIV